MTMRFKDVEALLDALDLHDHMSLSFHHHLRQGDAVLNLILAAILKRGYQNLNLFPSAIFPCHHAIEKAIQAGKIHNLTTNYINGPVANALKEKGLKGELKMQSHGGRARAIIEKENRIDIAFIAAPAVDQNLNASGLEGPSACGALGYVIEDVKHAKVKVLITDYTVNVLKNPQISGTDIDHLLTIPSIGDSSGIMSGTLKPTNDPLNLKIARLTQAFLQESGMIKAGVSYQSGAGGTSLAITQGFIETLKKQQITASFFTGGITAQHVQALEAGLVEKLYDVQCFDLKAIESLATNNAHQMISASDYANPNNPDRKIKDLDIVILGASEIDRAFNVNVTTDSYYTIIGGSGGHSDTAEDAKLTIVVSPLLKARLALIKDRVSAITTPGAYIDVLITERGIAINPKRQDLLKHFKHSNLPIMSIDDLQQLAYQFTGKPNPQKRPKKTIGFIESRHGCKLDSLYGK